MVIMKSNSSQYDDIINEYHNATSFLPLPYVYHKGI